MEEIKMERIYNKLVRDKIPNIIEEKGETPVVKVLDEINYKKELEKKLYEEYKEVIEANGDERIEELADMLEVIRALACLENKNLNDIIEKADKKSEKRGAFNQKIFLEKVIESKENS
jgi:predicted house-cleaning noncanonical NTP pyrophosphatase (MazG superfamily)